MFKNYPVYIVIFVVFLYILIPFLAPVFFSIGQINIGKGINEIYEPFCHQRVERSIFLFSKSGLVNEYSVEDLKNLGYLPINPKNVDVWPEYYGHDYYGNKEVGFKVPLCIRDIALYLGFVITGIGVVLYSEKNKRKLVVPFTTLLVLLIPMMVDGVGESIIEALKLHFVPMWFINDWIRRVITGTMFGIGCALYIVPAFYTDNNEDKKKVD